MGALISKLDDSNALLDAHTAFPHSPGLATITGKLSIAGIGSLLSKPIVSGAAGAALGRDVHDLLSCTLPSTAEVTYGRMSVDISNLHSVHSACLLAFVQLVASSPSVVRLGVASRPRLTNYEARGVTQTGKMGGEAYRAAGITGEGQVTISIYRWHL